MTPILAGGFGGLLFFVLLFGGLMLTLAIVEWVRNYRAQKRNREARLNELEKQVYRLEMGRRESSRVGEQKKSPSRKTSRRVNKKS